MSAGRTLTDSQRASERSGLGPLGTMPGHSAKHGELYYVPLMDSAVLAAYIAAGASLVTLAGTTISQRLASRATSHDNEKTLSQLDRTLAEQRTRTLNERFATAAGQLGSDKPSAVRLAGVYAMAGLADDWAEGRKTCVDVLCAYLRMPHEPDPGEDAPEPERLAFQASREVRHTVIRVISAHLRDGSKVSWQGLDLDFTGVVFDGGDFSFARFADGQFSFVGAKFSNVVNFSYAQFSGGAYFNGAEFSGVVLFDEATFWPGAVDFVGAKFSGGEVSFRAADFSSHVSFVGAEFSGAKVSLSQAKFSAREVFFTHAKFTGGAVSFDNAYFSGAKVSFENATFTGGGVSFHAAAFSGGDVSFSEAAFSGAKVDFTEARFSGGSVSFYRAAFSGGKASFQNAAFTAGSVNFTLAAFSGGDVSFHYGAFTGGVVSFLTAVFSGGKVSFTGARFSGSEVRFPGANFSGSKVDFTQPADWKHPPTFDFAEAPLGVTLPAPSPPAVS